jgi:hypothetical protein
VGLTDFVGNKRGRRRKLQTPMMNFSSARRCFQEGAKGVEGGHLGVFMGGLGLRRGLGFCSGGAMDGGECVGLAWDSCWRKKRGLTRGAGLSAAGSVPLQVLASWASV